MNIRDLQYIIAVAETRHFGKAAQRCFVSQPTLSGQIKKLEEHLGVEIFERTNRSVEVTPIGDQIVQYARRIIEQADAIEQLSRAHQDPLVGPLRIGAIPTLSPYLMPLILVPLKKQHPQMRLVLYEELTEILLQRLEKHEIDAALVASPVEDPGMISIPLFSEPFWVAFPGKHRFYTKERITPKDLEKEEMLLLAEGHCLAQQTMELCHLSLRHNHGEMTDLRAGSLETLIQLVAAGFGVTLVPALAMGGSWTTGIGVVAQPLNSSKAARKISLVYRQSFPRIQAIQALIKVISENLPNTVQKIGMKAKSKVS